MPFWGGRSKSAGAGGRSAGHTTLVLLGPVVGKVTDTTANVLLEVDDEGTVVCFAKPRGGGPTIKSAVQMRAWRPGVFVLKGLTPSTKYDITFEGVARVHVDKLQARGCVVTTFPPQKDTKQLRIFALSCDYPSRLPDGAPNPWDHLAAECKAGKCDLMLHLGDQVQTWENGCMLACMRVMEEGKLENIIPAVREKTEAMSRRKLSESYQNVWSQPGKATALANTSHIMLWSDNDVTNDFTVARKKDGSQEYDADYLSVAMHVYRGYQRSLWDPAASLMTLAQFRAETAVREFHFHTYGPCGIVMIDSRGNRIKPNGELTEGLRDLLSDEQRKAITDAFATPDLRCMLVCSEIPFVGPDPSTIVEQAEKFPFLKDHWAFQTHELIWLMDQCFTWKAAESGREVLLLGGDIHVGVDSSVTDSQSGLTIRQITASPITNYAGVFHPKTEGSLNERYTYQHTPKEKERNYCCIDLDFRGASVVMEARLLGESDMAKPQAEDQPPPTDTEGESIDELEIQDRMAEGYSRHHAILVILTQRERQRLSLLR